MDFITNEELLCFLRRKKTEISCMEQPHIFLSQLRDHDLLPENVYEKVKSMRSREQKQKVVYEVLDWLEEERSEDMHRFWRCVFKEHVLHQYPTLRMFQKSLLDGTYKSDEPSVEDETLMESKRHAEKGKDKKNGEKRKNDDGNSSSSEDPGPSTSSTPVRKKPKKKPSFSSPVKKGDKQEIWKLPIYKSQLPVTCGDKEGTLHREKLPKGEKCILSNDRWFTPWGFERFAGKENWKNWKISIRCRDTTLKKLIEEGHLQCPPNEKRRTTCAKNCTKKNIPVQFSSSESSSADSETSEDSTVDSDSEDFQEQRGRGRSEFRGRVEMKMRRMRKKKWQICLSSGCSLYPSPVDHLQELYTKSGSRGKCIRTEESWFTPEEFVKQKRTLTAAHWKRDVLCHGKTLNFLIKKKILKIHRFQCKCLKCSDRDEVLMDQNNDDECFVCHSDKNLICCDACPRAFHSTCHLPFVDPGSTGDWFCTFCVLNQQRRDSSNKTEQEALNAPVSQYKMHCRYLLLFLYNQDCKKVFVGDPVKEVARYSEFISRPMWLNRIKMKLDGDEYQKVGEFIADFQLIFSNCRTFNRTNKFGQMGARLKEMFDEEFQNVFSIQ